MSDDRPLRADARRNADGVVQAARAVFAEAGVDAPVRDIAARAGVGTGTLYRRFPSRADLIAAVFRQEIDDCADAAEALAAAQAPGAALGAWLQRYADFVATKRGFAAALHSGDPAYSVLPAHRDRRLLPALDGLLTAAVAAGQARPGIDASELLAAVTDLCHGGDPDRSSRMVALLADGLRAGAAQTATGPAFRA